MKQLMLFVLLISIGSVASAQQNNDRRDEIESYKIAYLTQKMDLTPEEAKVFWPIYKNWQNEQMTIRKERAQNMNSYRRIDDLSDAEVQKLIANELNIKQRSLNIEKKYYNQLKSSLPIKTIGKYYRAQETFKKELLNRYKDGRRSNQP